MKNYKVTVNGNTYHVSIEEIDGQGEAFSQAVAAPPTAPVAAPIQAAAPTPAPAPAASTAAAGTPVKAPMPGTVLDIKVNVGDSVKANQPIIILEAMKMENEIVTPIAGKILSINVAKGASVNTDDTLAVVGS